MGRQPMKKRIQDPAYPEVFLDVLFRGTKSRRGSEPQISAIPGRRRYDFEKVVVHGPWAGILDAPFDGLRSAVAFLTRSCIHVGSVWIPAARS